MGKFYPVPSQINPGAESRRPLVLGICQECKQMTARRKPRLPPGLAQKPIDGCSHQSSKRMQSQRAARCGQYRLCGVPSWLRRVITNVDSLRFTRMDTSDHQVGYCAGCEGNSRQPSPAQMRRLEVGQRRALLQVARELGNAGNDGPERSRACSVSATRSVETEDSVYLESGIPGLHRSS